MDLKFTASCYGSTFEQNVRYLAFIIYNNFVVTALSWIFSCNSPTWIVFYIPWLMCHIIYYCSYNLWFNQHFNLSCYLRISEGWYQHFSLMFPSFTVLAFKRALDDLCRHFCLSLIAQYIQLRLRIFLGLVSVFPLPSLFTRFSFQEHHLEVESAVVPQSSHRH